MDVNISCIIIINPNGKHTRSGGKARFYANKILQTTIQISLSKTLGDPTRNLKFYDWVDRGERKDDNSAARSNNSARKHFSLSSV